MKKKSVAAIALAFTLTLSACATEPSAKRRKAEPSEDPTTTTEPGETSEQNASEPGNEPDLFGNPDLEGRHNGGLMTSLDVDDPLLIDIYTCYSMEGLGTMYSDIVSGADLTVEVGYHDTSDISHNGLEMYVFAYNEEYAWNTNDAYVKLHGDPCSCYVGDSIKPLFWINGTLPDNMDPGMYTLVFVRDDGVVDAVSDIRVVKEGQVRETYVVDKPVIYLYPEEEMDVNVQLKLNGQFRCTYPKYDDNFGWTVTADPSGRLHNLADGRNYDYLFWEGVTDVDFGKFEKAVCVAGEDTAAFLEAYLEACGLNDSEIDDFVSFWLPKMECNAYNLISFPMEDYENMAELSVSPSPDTVIRVFMAFKALDQEVVIPQDQALSMPEGIVRNGFTVVEWGGTEIF